MGQECGAVFRKRTAQLSDRGRGFAIKRLLFLCTGNYYRSRFAELLFNWLADKEAVGWRAFSRALAVELGAENIGPISANAVRGLEQRGIHLSGKQRFPIQVSENDFAEADCVIAAKESEHRPFVEQRFSAWAGKVAYWNIDDVGDAPASVSCAEMERRVRELIRALRQAREPASTRAGSQDPPAAGGNKMPGDSTVPPRGFPA
jgi:protein-tyrosine phosphatase